MEKGASNNEKIVVGALKQCEKVKYNDGYEALFLNGVSSIGELFPCVDTPICVTPWRSVANDFYQCGNDIRKAVNEYAAEASCQQS